MDRAGHDPVVRPEPTIGQRAARGVPWIAAATWINRLMLVVILAVLAGALGPRGFGVLSIALFASNLLIILNDFGFGNALIYQPGDVRKAAESAFLISLLSGIGLGALLLAAAPFITRFFSVPEATNIMRAFGVVIALNAASQVPVALLSRALAFRLRFFAEAVPAVVGAACTIIGVELGWGLWSVVAGESIRYLLALVIGWLALPMRLVPRWHARMVSDLWRFARSSLVASGLDFILLNIDYALVGKLLGPVALGYYSFAFRLAIIPFFVVAMVAIGVSWPAMARLMPDMTRIEQAFRSTVRLTLAGVFLLAGGIVALAPWVQVLGARWEPAITPTRLLGVYTCVRSAAYLLSALFQATGRPAVNAVLRGIWIALLGILILAFGRRGIMTVAGLQIIVAVVLLVAYLIAGGRILGIAPRNLLQDSLGPGVAAILAGGLTVLVTASGWPGLSHSSGGALVIMSFLFAAAYFSALWVLAPSVRVEVKKLVSGRTHSQTGVSSVQAPE